MEGFKRLGLLTKSIRFRLIVVATLIGMVCSAISSYMSYFNFKQDSLDFLDEELRQVAAAAINYDMIIPKRWDGPRHRYAHLNGSDYLIHENFRLFQGNDSEPIIIAPLYGRSSDAIFIPNGIKDGLYTLILSDERTRVLLVTHYNGRRFIVARSLGMTMEMAKNAFISSLIEFLFLTIVYAVFVALSLNLVFKAVTGLGYEVSKIKADSLNPINKNTDSIYIPLELHGFIDAINLLLKRIDWYMQNQKRFIADAAHEMRTPLTALSLQVESLCKDDLPPTSKAKLEALKEGILREKELMTSLLTLARMQSGTKANDIMDIDVKELYISLIDSLGAIADDKNIDFGIEGKINSVLHCSFSDIKSVMTNLCSNALKYTPEGGRVDLICIEDEKNITLTVKDNGPGIGQDELDKVLEPFYRCGADTSAHIGTGLGLAIAKACADRLKGRICMRNAKEGGLEAMLILPKAC